MTTLSYATIVLACMRLLTSSFSARLVVGRKPMMALGLTVAYFAIAGITLGVLYYFKL